MPGGCRLRSEYLDQGADGDAVAGSCDAAGSDHDASGFADAVSEFRSSVDQSQFEQSFRKRTVQQCATAAGSRSVRVIALVEECEMAGQFKTGWDWQCHHEFKGRSGNLASRISIVGEPEWQPSANGFRSKAGLVQVAATHKILVVQGDQK